MKNIREELPNTIVCCEPFTHVGLDWVMQRSAQLGKQGYQNSTDFAIRPVVASTAHATSTHDIIHALATSVCCTHVTVGPQASTAR